MPWVIVAAAVLLLGLAAFLAVGKLGSVPEPDTDMYAPTLPEGRLTSQDVRGVKFGVAMRGYDMKQVDALLQRLAAQLEDSGEWPAAAGSAPAATGVDPAPVSAGPAAPAEGLGAANRATAVSPMRDNDDRRENAES